VNLTRGMAKWVEKLDLTEQNKKKEREHYEVFSINLQSNRHIALTHANEAADSRRAARCCPLTASAQTDKGARGNGSSTWFEPEWETKIKLHYWQFAYLKKTRNLSLRELLVKISTHTFFKKYYL